MTQPSSPGKRGSGNIPDARQYGAVGLQFAAGILVFAFLGNWLDHRLGTGPWLLMVGVFGGFGLSLYWIWRRLAAPQGPR